MTPYGAPEGVAKAYKARMILEAGGFEYCELHFKDIRFYKTYRKCVDMFIAANGEKHRATVWNYRAMPALRIPLVDLLISKGVPPR